MEKLHVIVKDPINLECHITGIPTPDLVWLRGDKLLDTTQISNMRILSEGRVLQIMSAEVTDADRYTCRASNPAGESDKYFELDVYGKHVAPGIDICYFHPLKLNIFCS